MSAADGRLLESLTAALETLDSRLLARATRDLEAAPIGVDPELVEPILGPLIATIAERTDELVSATATPLAGSAPLAG